MITGDVVCVVWPSLGDNGDAPNSAQVYSVLEGFLPQGRVMI